MKSKRRAWWKRRTIRLMVPVLGGLIAFGGTTLAANILKSFDGSWRGKGTIVIENSGGAEAVVCRTNGKAAADGNSADGYPAVVAVATSRAPFRSPSRRPVAGRYTGSWKSRGQKGGSAAISGRQRGKSLVFSIRSNQPGRRDPAIDQRPFRRPVSPARQRRAHRRRQGGGFRRHFVQAAVRTGWERRSIPFDRLMFQTVRMRHFPGPERPPCSYRFSMN